MRVPKRITVWCAALSLWACNPPTVEPPNGDDDPGLLPAGRACEADE